MERRRAALILSLAGIFVAYYYRHRQSRTKADVTEDERRVVELAAYRTARQEVHNRRGFSPGQLAVRMQNHAMALLRKLVRADP